MKNAHKPQRLEEIKVAVGEGKKGAKQNRHLSVSQVDSGYGNGDDDSIQRQRQQVQASILGAELILVGL